MRYSKNQLLNQLLDSLEQLDEDQVLMNIKALINIGFKNYQLLDYINEGMLRVGKLYEVGEYFIADLIISGEIYKKALKLPEMQIPSSTDGKKLGRILIGTAHGDVHDIGKGLVISTLSANGFEVVDLGVDVSPKVFVQETRRYQPDIVAISGVVSYALDAMEITINMLEDANLRERVKIIVGGLCVDNAISKDIGADAYAPDPLSSVKKCKELLTKADKVKQ